jgi:hypothetical protein
MAVFLNGQNITPGSTMRSSLMGAGGTGGSFFGPGAFEAGMAGSPALQAYGFGGGSGPASPAPVMSLPPATSPGTVLGQPWMDPAAPGGLTGLSSSDIMSRNADGTLDVSRFGQFSTTAPQIGTTPGFDGGSTPITVAPSPGVSVSPSTSGTGGMGTTPSFDDTGTGAGSQGASGNVGATPSSGDNVVGYGTGVVQANPSLVGATNQVAANFTKGAEEIGKDTKEAGKTIGQSVSGFGSTIKGVSDSWQTALETTLVRVAFIVMGLVIFGAALFYFGRPTLQQAAKGASKFIPV